MTATRIDTPPIIDGRLSEAMWGSAKAVPLNWGNTVEKIAVPE